MSKMSELHAQMNDHTDVLGLRDMMLSLAKPRRLPDHWDWNQEDLAVEVDNLQAELMQKEHRIDELEDQLAKIRNYVLNL